VTTTDGIRRVCSEIIERDEVDGMKQEVDSENNVRVGGLVTVHDDG